MTIPHPLDRPVWNALATGWSALAQGDDKARRLDPAFGPFAASADGSPENLAALTALLPADGALWIVETGALAPPPGAVQLRTTDLHQMVAPRITPAAPHFTIEPLTAADAPDMQALARLTEPGPFAARTHELAEFLGVKQDGKLVAMAGERMRPQGFAEVSGVCTHPDHRGQGYAGGLMRAVAERILARGETPFLHVYPSNTGAIALYEALGFVLRRPITLTLLARADAPPAA
ncbi:FR47-like protein [Sphingomonas laterariae]|uniref:FR47-like protein n=1 Tax=Edaphosphingomonas laterariae TaxID=861865 RepID=A0A239CC10_9SPHN|nr:GNAT family N-acetyltransferase [Sphingomonas laterariae]SNS17767.1 FR47-like protein [Sphingomonas laterariae]